MTNKFMIYKIEMKMSKSNACDQFDHEYRSVSYGNMSMPNNT